MPAPPYLRAHLCTAPLKLGKSEPTVSFAETHAGCNGLLKLSALKHLAVASSGHESACEKIALDDKRRHSYLKFHMNARKVPSKILASPLCQPTFEEILFDPIIFNN